MISMAKNILVLTTIYPSPDIQVSNTTNVVHYFAQEWVKKGYNVRVVFNYPIYLKALHFIAGFMKNTLASKFNTSVTATYTNKEIEYEIDGVKSVRMPLYKPLPRYKVPDKSLNRQIIRIVEYCKKNNFIPDIITSHNFYPHLPMVNRLKEDYFKKSKTCVVVHKQVWKMLKYCGNDYKKEIDKVDTWGYRSKPLKEEFEKNTGCIPEKWFMCYSGIPAHFSNTDKNCNIQKPINRFIYVGSFIRRKYPEKLLEAINLCNLKDFRLDYIGDGSNRHIIEDIINKNRWLDNIKLHGCVKREQVPNFIEEAQCFIMISEEETFGLVYLEAMSMGCITIASRNEGMEGIIVDGKNGFLCKAGDEHELASIINKINQMPQDKLNEISINAIKTAKELTDDKVAEHYINSII